MSELKRKDLDDLHQRLRERRGELRHAIENALADRGREDFTEIIGRVRDAGEESVAEFVASTNLSLLDREVNELREVEGALARMRDDTYGRCVVCGQDIGRERLKAYPTATLCVDDAERVERARAGGQDASPSL